ncbi:MAG TPA: sensor histidine kinase KdpD [Terriglobales bacterium]|nr:sensor histidine kinase KdpD [Terriglobales bacterium]
MPTPKPGRLTIFLGYAAGVGKTYRMLIEAQALARARMDVVIGYFEPHGRRDTMALAATLETVSRRRIEYRGRHFEEMDTEAILRRHPNVCLVDEFAHTNVPTSPRGKRWEDVQLLLAAGIDVFTTMNVQHLESLNDQVWQISGVRVRETVPDWVIRQAGEFVMVDLSTRALLNRLQRGVIYEPAKAHAALAHFFQEPTLVALRELALRQTAHEIEVRQPEAAQAAPPAPPAERVLVHVTADPAAAMILRRGWRVANYLRADCYAVHVQAAERGGAGPHAVVERHLAFARNLRIETRTLQGSDVAGTLVDFAHEHGITQIFLARPRPTTSGRALVARVVQLARDMQVTVVAERRR